MSKTKFFTEGKQRKHSFQKLGADLIQGLAQESMKLTADCGRELFGASGMPVADRRRLVKSGGKTIVLIEKR